MKIPLVRIPRAEWIMGGKRGRRETCKEAPTAVQRRVGIGGSDLVTSGDKWLDLGYSLEREPTGPGCSATSPQSLESSTLDRALYLFPEGLIQVSPRH